MRITKAMIAAAQRAEFDAIQGQRALGPARFVPTPPEVVRAMLKAALGTAEMEIRAKEARPPPRRPKLTLVTVAKPQPER